MDQPDYDALAEAAMAARDRAYAPYSRFRVGAALLCGSGKVYLGGNIENAAYSMTVCAERVALFSAYAAGEREFVALAVATDTDDVASPCGACRQVIFELAPRADLLLLNLRGQRKLSSPAKLLPHGFGPAQLDEAAREGSGV